METKHTPGPWSTYVNRMNDTTIRSMFPDGQERCEVARCRTSFDDARLIAAAPDLLHQRDELMSTIIAAAALAPIDSPCKRLLDEAISNMKGGA